MAEITYKFSESRDVLELSAEDCKMLLPPLTAALNKAKLSEDIINTFPAAIKRLVEKQIAYLELMIELMQKIVANDKTLEDI